MRKTYPEKRQGNRLSQNRFYSFKLCRYDPRNMATVPVRLYTFACDQYLTFSYLFPNASLFASLSSNLSTLDVQSENTIPSKEENDHKYTRITFLLFYTQV